MNSLLSRYHSIDWSRLAEPQEDQYDTEITLQLAASTTSPARPERYVRKHTGNSTAIFDGHVAVRHVYGTLPGFQAMLANYHCVDAPNDHPNLGRAAEHIRSWPVAFTQCQRLLEAIHPIHYPAFSLDSDELYRGSLSDSYEHLFGTLWATIYCPVGLAESIVHEMAHQKLRALGVSFESATNIVGNDPSELYVSPVIKDRLRPMTAVLHAQYSFVHVTALDVHMFAAEQSPLKREIFGQVLQSNLSKIEEGYLTIRKHIKPAQHGKEFLDGFFSWTERTILSAKDLLARGSSVKAE